MDALLEGAEADPLPAALEAFAQAVERHEVVVGVCQLASVRHCRPAEREIGIGRRHPRSFAHRSTPRNYAPSTSATTATGCNVATCAAAALVVPCRASSASIGKEGVGGSPGGERPSLGSVAEQRSKTFAAESPVTRQRGRCSLIRLRLTAPQAANNVARYPASPPPAPRLPPARRSVWPVAPASSRCTASRGVGSTRPRRRGR